MYLTHPACRLHEMGSWHPESPQRLDAISDQLLASGLMPYLEDRQAQQASRNARRTASATGNLERAQRLNRQAENAGRTTNDSRQVVDVIKLQTLDDAKAVAQRIGQHAGARGGAHQGKRW